MIYYRYSGDKDIAYTFKAIADKEFIKHDDHVRLGNLSQFRSQRKYDSGVVFTFLSYMGDTIVEIYVPKKKKNKQTSTTITKQWVMMLEICATAAWFRGATLGVLIVDQEFNVIAFLKNDGSEQFNWINDWEHYYGFKSVWRNVDLGEKYELEELPRRSTNNLLIDEWGEDDTSGVEDTDWIPGPNYRWGDNIPDQPEWYLTGGFYGMFSDTSYDDGGYPDRYFVSDTVYMTPWETDVGNVSWYSNPAMLRLQQETLDPIYNVSGLTGYGGGTSWESTYNMYADFNLVTMYVYQYGEWRTSSMGFWLSMGIPVDVIQGFWYTDVWPYPGDGIQRRVYSSYVLDNIKYLFYDWRTDEHSPYIMERVQIEELSWDSWVEGVWTMQQETTESISLTETYYPWTGDCCVRTNPQDSLPQEVFPDFAHWLIFESIIPAQSKTEAYSPCAWSYYWGSGYGEMTTPHQKLHFDDDYLCQVRFDDGHMEPLSPVAPYISSSDYDVYENSLDNAIYDYKGIPVYVAHYQFVGLDKQCVLLYYYKQEFRMSEKYDQFDYYLADAFNSLNNYGGYWSGQVRVCELTITKQKEVGDD
jgi:hypothetical protein